jgi:glycosyltransferase involved in cell wall biosynthesis
LTDFRLTVAVPDLGVPSQVWVYRQITSMTDVAAHVLHWGRGAQAEALAARFDTVDVGRRAKPVSRTDRARWLHRLATLPSGNHFAADRASCTAIVRALAPRGPDVLLAHFGHTALCLIPVARRLRRPLIAHFHGTDLSESLINNRWYRWSLLRSLPCFHACIVVGSHQKRLLLEHGVPADRIHLLPCGVPTDAFSPAEPSENAIFRFVIVSRLIRSKGIDVSLCAFARVAERMPETELHIVGDGPDRERLVNRAGELSLGERVRFHGVMDEAEVAAILRRSDAFLQHSLEVNGWVEGFGVSVAEAAATGLPVVVSRSGGLVDQVVDGETGFTVPMGDVGAMADAMGRLCADRALARRLGAAGRQRMVAEFDSDTLTGRLRAVLAEAASAGRAQGPTS